MSQYTDKIIATFETAKVKPGSEWRRVGESDTSTEDTLVLSDGLEVKRFTRNLNNGDQVRNYSFADTTIQTRRGINDITGENFEDIQMKSGKDAFRNEFNYHRSGAQETISASSKGVKYGSTDSLHVFLRIMDTTLSSVTDASARNVATGQEQQQYSATEFPVGSIIPTTRIHVEGSSISSQHGAEKAHTYRTPGEDVGPQKPHGKT